MLWLWPVKRWTKVQSTGQRGISAAQSVFLLLDEEGEKDTGNESSDQASGKLEFRNGSFSYATGNDAVLKDISFSTEAGKTIAIVGRSGSGKSTLASLLPRFYDVTEGEILLDDFPINDIKLDNLRAQISLVSQDVTLFNDTVANNIAYGSCRNIVKKKFWLPQKQRMLWNLSKPCRKVFIRWWGTKVFCYPVGSANALR